MRSLYPPIEPREAGHLDTGDGHRVYFEDSGNPRGLPVVFLHGGPGAGSNANHRRYFDPALYRIINTDQRGCHRSIPAGSIDANTTPHLVADMERLREHLGIDRWMIFGGSWGATLGLIYAQTHPERVTAMVLRGTFLARHRDLDWFLGDGACRIFPEVWQRFVGHIPETERENLAGAYAGRLQSPDPEVQLAAARHWAEWAGRIVTWNLPVESFCLPDDDTSLINEVRIETHYARHNYFLEEDQILTGLDKLPAVPITLIHGRRDLTCPLEASWDLHRRLPGSRLIVVRDGGHLAGEAVMVDALIQATDNMAATPGLSP